MAGYKPMCPKNPTDFEKGYCYVALSYYDNRNKWYVKYVSTGLPEKENKRKAEAALACVRGEFEPP